MNAELRESLAQVQELLDAMPSQELTVYDANEGDGWPPRPLWSLKNAAYDANAEDDCVQLSLNFGHKNDADALAACFNFLRTHGPELMKMLEGKDG
jgi:hypothetical protein